MQEVKIIRISGGYPGLGREGPRREDRYKTEIGMRGREGLREGKGCLKGE